MKKYVAYIIDLALYIGVTSLYYLFFQVFLMENNISKSYFMIVCAIISMIYMTTIFPHQTKGQTIGMYLTKIKVVNRDGSPRTYFQSFIRELVLKFSMGPFFMIMTLAYLVIWNGVIKRDFSRDLPHDIFLNTRIKEI
ncbi:MAG: RDD family protein [Erysipelotrichaceae bacterium]|nr:RDD family protein [Erysipelotrichaceae bacterium]